MIEDNKSLKKNAFSGFVWKLAERLGAQGVSLVVSIVLARLLLPEDYAVVGVVTIFFAFCNVLVSDGLSTALIQKKNSDAIDYNTILFVSLGLSSLFYVILFFTAPFIADIYEMPLVIPAIRVMGLTLIINSFKSVLSAYVSSRLEFRQFFYSTIAANIFSAIVGIGMAIGGFGVWALIAQQMSNSLMGTIVLFFTTKFKVKLIFSFNRLKSLFSYGWKIFVMNALSVLYDEINPMVVGLKFSSVDLSFYTKGKSFPSLINTTISDTLSSVLFPVMSKLQDSKEAVLDITRKYIKVSTYLLFPIMLGFLAVSENFILLLLTDKWLPAVPYLQIFCLSYMVQVIHVGNIQAIKAIGRSDICLIMEIIKKTLNFSIIAVFVFLSSSPVILALSSIVCNLVALIVNTFPNRKLIGYRYRMQIMDILPNLIIAAIMCVIVLLMKNLPFAPIITMPLQIIAGIVIYFALSIITKNENMSYLLKTLKQFVRR
ncbi:MAG: lipopolysaccharide biosynthesis protein [Clostridia bacterium]|nr:lipopolysaccharide biosynthesis protein [Clostridia bacterium]